RETLAATGGADLHPACIHPPRVKRVVQLFMAGAASHIDLFDHKPELVKRHGEPSDFGEPVEAFQDGLGPWLKPVWDFQPSGGCGKLLAEVVSPLGSVVDRLAFIHDMVSTSGVHSAATLLQTTGFVLPGFPGAGCWVSYALGSLNDNLPTFVVLPDHRGYGSNGVKNWDAGFLPAQFSGTVVQPAADEPVADLRPHAAGAFVTAAADAAARDTLGRLNRRHEAARPGDTRLEARIQSYELAARMQLAVPTVTDLSTETAATLRAYGADDAGQPIKAAFARNCILARRLLEQGVRFVQLFNGAYASGGELNWDGHSKLREQYDRHAMILDQPAAALIRDLRSRGMLDDTLVVWCTEFGRMPFFQKGAQGRDHNPDGFTCWLTGAGVKPGVSHGRTDDLGVRAVEDVHPLYDFNATILWLLGLDHRRLSFRHNGVDRRLTDVHGRVIREVLA
ncbi:MAG: DUF1501 domain-containing protein, partial [Planctomycetaceae bacterium]